MIKLFMKFSNCFYTVRDTRGLLQSATVVSLQGCLDPLQDAWANCVSHMFFILLLSILRKDSGNVALQARAPCVDV